MDDGSAVMLTDHKPTRLRDPRSSKRKAPSAELDRVPPRRVLVRIARESYSASRAKVTGLLAFEPRHQVVGPARNNNAARQSRSHTSARIYCYSLHPIQSIETMEPCPDRTFVKVGSFSGVT